MFYSIILPTFGRPGDVNAFLQSFTQQTYTHYEIIIVDGSPDDCLKPIIEKYTPQLPLTYIYDKGLGASESRNKGCEKATGDYLVFIDSDCIVPPHYLKTINDFLQNTPVEGFGGPDREHPDFTPIQKAISYAMTSTLTTGGIRGRKKHIGKFQLRGFNMGIKRDVFFSIGGFSGMQVAEDIDISMRLLKAGYSTALIPEAFVYHRRKSTLRKFFKQLFMHGKGRIDLYIRHRDALKLVHCLPSLFVLYLIIGTLLSFFNTLWAAFFAGTLFIYAVSLFIDATVQNKSAYVGFLSMVASFEMLIAYGLGLMKNFIARIILKSNKDSIKDTILKE